MCLICPLFVYFTVLIKPLFVLIYGADDTSICFFHISVVTSIVFLYGAYDTSTCISLWCRLNLYLSYSMVLIKPKFFYFMVLIKPLFVLLYGALVVLYLFYSMVLMNVAYLDKILEFSTWCRLKQWIAGFWFLRV